MEYIPFFLLLFLHASLPSPILTKPSSNSVEFFSAQKLYTMLHVKFIPLGKPKNKQLNKTPSQHTEQS